MSAISSTPTDPYRRRGVAKTLTLDQDALVLLYELAPTRRHLGRIVSELIRGETLRREERARAREVLQAALATID
jgi:hypothetical protein